MTPEDTDITEELDTQTRTETEILDSIGEGDDTDANGVPLDTGDDNESQTVTTESPAETPAPQTVQQTPSEQQSVTQSSGDGAQVYHVESLRKYANTYLPEDAQGNLVDPDTKQLVVRAGAERHFFEAARNSTQKLADTTQRLQQVEQLGRDYENQVRGYEAANSAAREGNLDISEQTQAVQLAVAYKKDPVATLKYMLTEAAANGIDLNQIMQGSSSLDMGAIKTLIDTRLAPLTQQQQQEQTQQQYAAEADRQAQAFFTQYPDAVIHEKVLADFLGKNPTNSPEIAYYKLKEWAARQQLDWGRPLVEQIAERQSAPTTTANQDTQPRTPMPTGRTAGAVAANSNGVNDASLSAHTTSDDIVREAMLEAGINIQ